MAQRICSVSECGARHYGRGWCEKHYNRWRKTGDPMRSATGRTASSPAARTSPHPSKGKRVSTTLGYKGAHKRVRSLRGKASAYPCALCSGPASEWAYTHTDAAGEMVEVLHIFGKTPRPIPYSPDPTFYEPMCHPCHVSTDVANIAREVIAK